MQSITSAKRDYLLDSGWISYLTIGQSSNWQTKITIYHRNKYYIQLNFLNVPSHVAKVSSLLGSYKKSIMHIP